MFKRYLSILKRNKQQLSNKELEWQAGKRALIIVGYMFFVILISILFSIFILVHPLDDSVIKIFFGYIIGILISFRLIFIPLFNGATGARYQIKENQKKEKYKKILTYMQNGDFTKLKLIDKEILQALFENSLNEVITIKLEENAVKIEIKDKVLRWIPNELLLETFDINVDE